MLVALGHSFAHPENCKRHFKSDDNDNDSDNDDDDDVNDNDNDNDNDDGEVTKLYDFNNPENSND